uniref:NB-ARC domain-containing protein n=1 Tax=Leersia perrieri TaxID=77586 RepID=A0A0D9XAE9_9ORYZ
MWMNDLKAVAYEADDVLDEFHYEALRREAQIGDSSTRKVLDYLTPQSPLLFRVSMSKKLNNVLKKINELVEEMNKFGLVERSTEAPQLPYRETHSALDESIDIFGRDSDREVVVKLLLDQRDEQKLQVLPVIGMGGLGKTTLAKMVYNDSLVKDHFQLKMWHCVSDDFEAVSLLKSIIGLATKNTCVLLGTIELLRHKLEEAIGRKRFLLVLDDVWNEDEKKWEDDLRPLLNSVGGPGSVMIVTTRSKRVASIMGTLGPHELQCLNEDASWEVFSKRAFAKQVREQVELVAIGRRIVKKCRGLPLALKTMGGLMSSKQLVSEWEIIAESNVGVRVQGKNDVLDILKLSYRHLSSEMKQCFAFCAVYPKDYEMEKEELIQLWMANGFIQEEGTMDLTDKGEMIFRDLVWRSFLQDVKAKRIYFYGGDSIVCKMHDLMHDLAIDATNECVSATKQLGQDKVSEKDIHHMQIQTGTTKEMMELFKGTSSLRTLIVRPKISRNFIKELRMASTRALSCSVINSHVMNAKHLGFLDLSDTSIVRLPNSVCTLYNLQSLRLNGCRYLKYLPEGMRTMRKLVHIYLYDCDSLQRMPPNISLLNKLRTLTTFVVDSEDGLGIEELKDLQRLANRLELYKLRKIKNKEKSQQANLYKKQNLREILLFWGRDKDYMPEYMANEEQVLESLAPPHGELKVLELHGYGGLAIPQWMEDPHTFQCLAKLCISNCPWFKDLPAVRFLVSLEHLSLYGMDNLTTLCNNDDVEAHGYGTSLQIFPKLKEMDLEKLPNLEIWAINISGEPNSLITLPQLETLRITNCPKLAGIPDCPSLRELKIERCPNIAVSSLAHVTTLCSLYYDAEGFNSMTMPLGSWQSLKELHVVSLPNMMCSLEELRSLIRLRHLFINFTNLEMNHSESEEILFLSQLETLDIQNSTVLKEIPKLPSSLERLSIVNCLNLVALPSNLGNLSRLRNLILGNCDTLKVLPDGMDGLTSLRRLSVVCCSGIEKFPEGLLRRLPTLEYLCLIGCSDQLVRRCKEGGEYFDLLSSIPKKEIEAVPGARSNIKKLVRRFLPSC